VLFPLILDLELISDISELYKPLWSDCFVKSRLSCEKNNNFIQLLEFGESFTIAAADSGVLYSWGSNEFNQLGRRSDLEEQNSSVSSINFNEFDCKQPQKVLNK